MRKETKRIVVYCVIAALFAGIMSYVYYKTQNHDWLMVMMLTPALSVLLTRGLTKEGFGQLYLKPFFKGNIKWYAAAYFLTPIIAQIGAVIYFLVFQNDFEPLGSTLAIQCKANTLGQYIQQLCVLIPFAIIVNPLFGIIPCLGEEMGWRGYLLPKLCQVTSPSKAVIISGAIWGIWHAAIVGVGLNYGEGHPIGAILSMIVFTIVLAIISSYLFFKTQSVWPSVLFHAAINGMDKWKAYALWMSKEPNYFIGPDFAGIVGGIGFIVLAVILYQKLDKLCFIKKAASINACSL